jgi:hypothetical protein
MASASAGHAIVSFSHTKVVSAEEESIAAAERSTCNVDAATRTLAGIDHPVFYCRIPIHFTVRIVPDIGTNPQKTVPALPLRAALAVLVPPSTAVPLLVGDGVPVQES